ncbi:MAG: BamA/TamA family outer membrane protein [Gemmatimonadetes bacterium]|nr:BamA/TamA family outer membrane protein [Gemmatimonadota bacterium]
MPARRSALLLGRSRDLAVGLLGLLVLLPALPNTASAQYFGRNKVQYETRDFFELSTPNWTIYFYEEESEAIEDIARMAERWYERFSRSFQHEFEGRKPLVIYADHPDFQQTNTLSGMIGQGTGGVTESLKNRVIMPLTSSYRETDRILGHELVHAFQFNVAQNRMTGGFMNLVRLPLWVVEGMAEYMSLGREDPHAAMWLHDHILRDDKPTLREISRNPKYFAYRFGQAFLSYIGGTYGDDAVQDFFRASLADGWEQGIQQVYGMPSDSISAEWWEAIEDAYRPLMAGKTDPYETGDVLLCEECGAGRVNVAPSLSPNGRYIVFQSEKDIFSMDLFLADVTTGRILRSLRRNETAYIDGIRYIDSSGSWSPDSRKLAFVVFADGDNHLAIMDVQSGRMEERIEVEGVGAIQNPAWSPDSRRIAFSGLRGGITDLYLYDLESGSVQQLTNDRHADLQASWSPDGKRLVFVSDRGPETSFERLSFGNYVLSFLELETLAVTPLSVFDGAKHINPVYDHTGDGIYFVADADGFSDIYHLGLSDGDLRRITRSVTGITGITSNSPPFSYSPRADLLAFSVFNERGYIINTAYPDSISTTVDLVAQAAPNPGRLLPPGDPAFPSRVARYLTDPYMGLVADSVYLADQAEPYNPSLGLDYIGQPTIGVGVDPYGGSASGATFATFSDMLGDRFLGVQLLANGTIRDIGGQAFYLNQKRRWNWGVGVQHTPTLFRRVEHGFTEFGTQYIIHHYRITVDAAEGVVAFPLSATRRLEAGLGFTRYGWHREVEWHDLDRFGRPLNYRREQIDTYKPLYLPSASAAFVGDNSYTAFTSPVRGARFRIEAGTTVGTANFHTLTLDYRRYFNTGGPVTLAARGLHLGRYGDLSNIQDRMHPFFLGYETLVRGYEYYSFDLQNECSTMVQTRCPEQERLFGHRVGVVNAEIRLPLTGIENFGLVNFPYLPLELTAFADAGVAWDRNDAPQLRFDRDTRDRVPVISTGFSLRANLLGMLVMEWYYAYPWHRPRAGWVSGFHFAPGW